jgi:hypothetical protein
MTEDILDEVRHRKYALLTPKELDELLTASELLAEVDTHINKIIRLLTYRGTLLLQEYSFEGEIFVRHMESREAAEAFVQKRLDTYERMWDGCGCTINFRD